MQWEDGNSTSERCNRQSSLQKKGAELQRLSLLAAFIGLGTVLSMHREEAFHNSRQNVDNSRNNDTVQIRKT